MWVACHQASIRASRCVRATRCTSSRSWPARGSGSPRMVSLSGPQGTTSLCVPWRKRWPQKVSFARCRSDANPARAGTDRHPGPVPAALLSRFLYRNRAYTELASTSPVPTGPGCCLPTARSGEPATLGGIEPLRHPWQSGRTERSRVSSRRRVSSVGAGLDGICTLGLGGCRVASTWLRGASVGS